MATYQALKPIDPAQLSDEIAAAGYSANLKTVRSNGEIVHDGGVPDSTWASLVSAHTIKAPVQIPTAALDDIRANGYNAAQLSFNKVLVYLAKVYFRTM